MGYQKVDFTFNVCSGKYFLFVEKSLFCYIKSGQNYSTVVYFWSTFNLSRSIQKLMEFPGFCLARLAHLKEFGIVDKS